MGEQWFPNWDGMRCRRDESPVTQFDFLPRGSGQWLPFLQDGGLIGGLFYAFGFYTIEFDVRLVL
jgi:hypothetical protein